MNQHPPKSPRPLDDEERALAKVLPRMHGRTTPGPDLDASILAAAQSAVHAAKPLRASIRPRFRWIAPASLAASMVLAVGMAWQLRPLPTLEPAQPTVQSDAAEMAEVQMIEQSPPDTPVGMVQSIPAPARSAPSAREQVISPANDALDASSSYDLSRTTPATVELREPEFPPVPPSPAPAPQSPPARAAALSEEAAQRAGSMDAASSDTLDTQGIDRSIRARTAEPAVATNAKREGLARDAAAGVANKPAIAERAQQAAPKTLSPSSIPPELRNEARMAAEARYVEDPDQDVPPATVDSPAVRDAWLQRIGELLEEGERSEAKASLAEFRRRYPAAVLPSRLRALEIEP